MNIKNVLYKQSIVINDNIQIVIPKVRDILEQEDAYYSIVTMLTAMPIDMMVMLDDVGIDFNSINEYELFLMLFRSMSTFDTSLVFGDLDISKFAPGINEANGMVALIDAENDIIIDRAIYEDIATAMRKIHGLKKDTRRAGNAEATKYLIERERKRLQRKARKAVNEPSQLESLITAMVNTEQFKYNYETVQDLTIYQFNESVHQIIHKVEYDNRMHGIYAGTVNVKDVSQDQLNWLQHK